MKKVSQLLIFILIVASHSSALWAGENLLKMGMEGLEKGLTSDITKMSPQGRRAYQEMRELAALKSKDYQRTIVFHSGNENEFSALVPHKEGEKSGGTIQQVRTRSNGDVTRSAFKIPPTEQEPSVTKLSSSGFAGGETPWVLVDRVWATATGETRLEQTFKSLNFDGRVLRVLQKAKLTTGPFVITAETDSGYGPGRTLHLEVADQRTYANGRLGPPTELKIVDPAIDCEIIGFTFSSDLSRLTIQTSSGLELRYRVEDHGEPTFTRINMSQLDLTEFDVALKKFKGRLTVAENKNAHDLQIRDADETQPISEVVK